MVNSITDDINLPEKLAQLRTTTMHGSKDIPIIILQQPAMCGKRLWKKKGRDQEHLLSY